MKCFCTLLFATMIQTSLCIPGSADETGSIISFENITGQSDCIVTATVVSADEQSVDIQVTAVLKQDGSISIGGYIVVQTGDDTGLYAPGDHILLYLSLVDGEYRLTSDKADGPGDETPTDTSAAETSVGISPNPFNPSTTISYSLMNPGRVCLSIYSITGQKVATLVNEYMPSGTHTVSFNGGNQASGTYIYRFESPGFTDTGKMLLVK